MRKNSRARRGRVRMSSASYFDAHLHLGSPDDNGFDNLLKMVTDDLTCVGGNLVLNTASELHTVLQRASDVPPWLQLIPCLDLLDRFPEELRCGWVKLHPQIQRINPARIPTVVAQIQELRRQLKGVMVHCFPWGRDIEFNCSLELVSALAQAVPECWVLATHGGGYQSWEFRAHVGGLKNVLFDFSASLSYYAGSDLLRPLQRYLTYAPDR